MPRNLAPRLAPLIVAAIVATTCAAQYYQVVGNAPAVTISGEPRAVGDFDSSGLPDLLMNGALVLDPGVNGMTPPILAAQAPPAYQLCAAGEINGDGNLDFFGTNGANPFPDSVLGQGNGTFVSQFNFPYLFAPGTQVDFVQLVDLNHDGRDDLVLQIRDPTVAFVQVLLNAFPQWVIGWSMPFPYLPWCSAQGDFDGDGNRDLCWVPGALAWPGPFYNPPSVTNQIFVALGDGSGGFGAPASHPFGMFVPPAGGGFAGNLVVDLDRDGRSDVLLSTPGTAFRVFYGHPSLGLEPDVLVPWPGAVAPLWGAQNSFAKLFAHDADADGDVDLVRIGWFGFAPLPVAPFVTQATSIDVLNATGYRAFAAAERRDLVIPAPGGAHYVAADWDQDGDVDLVGTPAQWIHGVHLDNTSLFEVGCPGQPGIPGTVQGDLALGNAGYYAGTHGAAPSSPAVFAVSLGNVVAGTCGIYVSPTHLVLPAGSFGITTTDALGAAILGLPLPAAPAIAGTIVYSQWFVVDPAGSLFVGGVLWAASRGRTLVLW